MHTQAIKEAALELFHRHSYTKTAIKDIAQACKLGKGTIYLYFKSKEDILLAIVEDRLLALKEEYRDYLDDRKVSLEEKLGTFMQVISAEYFNLKNLLFGSFENVEHKVIRSVFLNSDKYDVWFESFLTNLVRDYQPIDLVLPAPVLHQRISQYIDLIIGRIILFTFSHDWTDLKGLQELLKPLSFELFERFVFAPSHA